MCSPLLQPGSYRLTVTKDGFRPVSRTGITLLVAQLARIDQELELGPVTQEVQVLAAPPLLESETSAIGRIDHNVTDFYRAFGRFAHNRTVLMQPDSYGNVATPDPSAWRFRSPASTSTISARLASRWSPSPQPAPAR